MKQNQSVIQQIRGQINEKDHAYMVGFMGFLAGGIVSLLVGVHIAAVITLLFAGFFMGLFFGRGAKNESIRRILRDGLPKKEFLGE